ncbi:MAG: hypothetical protein ACLRM8_09430 [Alistipes sp.]
MVWRRRARITKTFDDGSVVVLARVKAETGDGDGASRARRAGTRAQTARRSG